jgi:hypothetical protein
MGDSSITREARVYGPATAVLNAWSYLFIAAVDDAHYIGALHASGVSLALAWMKRRGDMLQDAHGRAHASLLR